MKLSTLISEYRETHVIEGSRFGFGWTFWSTKLFSFLRQHSRLMQRVVPRMISLLPTATYVIENTVGRFQVESYDDSTTICSGYFEAHLRPWLTLPLEKKIFIDIGANRGLYTVLALKHFGYTTAHSIEPNPEVFANLKKNLILNELVEIVQLHQVALSNQVGTAHFTVDPLHKGGGHIVMNETPAAMVSTSTLDTLLGQGKAKEISFIKIDTEGFEFMVLSGMKQVLADMPVGSCLMIECTEYDTLVEILSPYRFIRIEYKAHDHLFQKHA